MIRQPDKWPAWAARKKVRASKWRSARDLLLCWLAMPSIIRENGAGNQSRRDLSRASVWSLPLGCKRNSDKLKWN